MPAPFFVVVSIERLNVSYERLPACEKRARFSR